MMLCKNLRTVAIATCLLAAAACNSKRSKAPDLQTQTPVQPVNQATTVSGCLRAGIADNTFVLNSPSTTGATDAVTYQLTAAPGVELRNYVGQQVDISGIVESEQQAIATSGKMEQRPAKGAAGTPSVETKTELDVRKLKVDQVKPTGNRCSD